MAIVGIAIGATVLSTAYGAYSSNQAAKDAQGKANNQGAMIAELEETFNVMLEMDEIIDFSSFNKGIEILGKHGIEI